MAPGVASETGDATLRQDGVVTASEAGNTEEQRWIVWETDMSEIERLPVRR